MAVGQCWFSRRMRAKCCIVSCVLYGVSKCCFTTEAAFMRAE